jgi:hypothetical protein
MFNTVVGAGAVGAVAGAASRYGSGSATLVMGKTKSVFPHIRANKYMLVTNMHMYNVSAALFFRYKCIRISCIILLCSQKQQVRYDIPL